MIKGIKSGAHFCLRPVKFAAHTGGSVLRSVGRNSVPNIYNFTLASFVGMYCGRVAMVFLPGILTGWAIADMTNRLGSEFFGYLIGGFIVAPTTVPTMVPFASWVIGGVATWATVLLTNMIYQLVMRLRGLEATPLPPLPSPKPPQTVNPQTA